MTYAISHMVFVSDGEVHFIPMRLASLPRKPSWAASSSSSSEVGYVGWDRSFRGDSSFDNVGLPCQEEHQTEGKDEYEDGDESSDKYALELSRLALNDANTNMRGGGIINTPPSFSPSLPLFLLLQLPSFSSPSIQTPI